MRNTFFFTSEQPKRFLCAHVRKCVILSIIFWTLYLYDRFGSTVYIQIVDIPIGINCTPLADLFLICYERDFMLFLSDNIQAGVIVAFNYTSI